MRQAHNFSKYSIGMMIIILYVFTPNLVFGQATIKKVGKFNTGMSYGLSIKNNYAYITTNTSLFILDLKNPEKPVKAGELVIGSPIFGIDVINNFAFLAASDKGLVIADISDPKNPHIFGEYGSGGTMYNVEVVNNYCYTINYENGFEIIDISKPAEPKKISGFQITPRGLSIQDNIAFVSDPENGLTILDISNPEEIKKLSIVNNTEGAGGINVNNGLLYLGSFNNWINVYNISEPRSPQFITRYMYPYEVSGIAVKDNFLITNYQGIKMKDISDLKNPISFAEYNARGLKGMAHGIVVQNEYIYYVKKGLTVLRIEKD
jgi:hypothetical protein